LPAIILLLALPLVNYKMESEGTNGVLFGIAYLPSKLTRKDCFLCNFCMLLFDAQ